MASAIKHSFKDAAVALIRGSWANRVARFCSFLMGRDGIDVTLSENPSPNSPNVISLNARVAAPKIYEEMKRIGVDFGGDVSAASNSEIDGNTKQTIADPPALATDTWTADPSADNPVGLEITIPTRVLQVGSLHYIYYRKMTFSPGGRLKSVSAEVGLAQIRA